MKKFKYLLQLFDGLWSVPLSFGAFYLIGIVLGWLFGYGAGSYDPAFIQPLFLAAAVVIGATNISVLGIWFTLRGIHRYIYGFKNEDGNYFNPSKEDYKSIKPIQKLVIALAVLLYFITAVLVVYLKLV